MRGRVAIWFTCVVLALTAWANDPWKEKNYKDWDEKEVNKILSDSPWSRPVTISAIWRSGSTSGAISGAQKEGSEVATGSGTSMAGGASASPSGIEGGGNSPEARFVVRWSSARTMREALARLAMFKGVSAPEAERIMNQPVSEHQIVMFGPDMTPFAKSDELSLMQKTALKPKKSRQKISPVRVEVMHSEDGKRITGIVFYFAMKSDNGEPFVSVDEKSVEFECRAQDVSIRVSFEPQKMVNKAGSDFQ